MGTARFRSGSRIRVTQSARRRGHVRHGMPSHSWRVDFYASGRRDFGIMKKFKQTVLAAVCLSFLPVFAILAFGFEQSTNTVVTKMVTIDAQRPIAPPETGFFRLGGVSKSGNSISVNSRYIVKNSEPWLPVMGEFHFARYPEAYWEEEILKMKAGGVQVVSTYIFWIHHEEIEGQVRLDRAAKSQAFCGALRKTWDVRGRAHRPMGPRRGTQRRIPRLGAREIQSAHQ